MRSAIFGRHLVASVVMLLGVTLVLGFGYPLVVTGLSQLFFHQQANGSLLYRDGKLVGSALLGQSFTDSKGNPLPQYFQPRPSAAGAGYDASSSGASNLGPSNPLLIGFVAGVNTVGLDGRPSAANPLAYAIIAVMAIIFVGHTVVSMQAELHGNHLLPASVSQVASSVNPGGNMEGKEDRFGPEASALMTVGTMGTTAGATDSALDSYTPVGGTGAFVAILLGEISPGGDGGGLYSILVLALLSVFVAGLMVGRTPEFLGKKIRATQMKLVVTYVLTIPTTVLILGSTSLVIAAGTRSILNPGLHGLTEVTYAYASVANNNGSAFAGLAANTPWYDTTLGLAMLVGRFAPIVLALAIAGSLAGARVHARTRATLDTAGPTFVAFLLGVIVIVGGLIYFPMLILGPIGERIIG